MEEVKGGGRSGSLGVVPPEKLGGGDSAGDDACLDGVTEGGPTDADGDGDEGELLGGLADGDVGEEPAGGVTDGGASDAGGGEPEDGGGSVGAVGGGDGTEAGGEEALETGGGDNLGG